MIRTDIASTIVSSASCATKSLQVLAGVTNHHCEKRKRTPTKRKRTPTKKKGTH